MEHTFIDVENFICALYYKYCNVHKENVNSVLYKIFSKMLNAQSHHLPPTRDALRKHIMRANYQTAVWLGAISNDPVSHGPEGHGWILTDGQLSINWTSQQPPHAEILHISSYKCKKGYLNQKLCKNNCLVYTDTYGCWRNWSRCGIWRWWVWHRATNYSINVPAHQAQWNSIASDLASSIRINMECSSGYNGMSLKWPQHASNSDIIELTTTWCQTWYKCSPNNSHSLTTFISTYCTPSFNK